MAPLKWQLDTVVFNVCPFTAVSLCLCFAVSYVGSLYIFTSRKYGRDHPDTIKNRMRRIAVVCVSVVAVLWFFSTTSRSVKARDIFTWLGVRLQGVVMASVISVLLTMTLFIGPLALHYLDGVFSLYKDSQYWLSNLRNLMWIRNHVVGPLTEEFVFRACMLPLLVPSFGENWSMLLSPLFFGVAHFHHIFEKIREGESVTTALLQSAFQFLYTTLFGMYSAFLFLRTGHLVAPVLAHSFCNHMGFPQFGEIFGHPLRTRIVVMSLFVIGVVLWLALLLPVTSPSLFNNDLYY